MSSQSPVIPKGLRTCLNSFQDSTSNPNTSDTAEIPTPLTQQQAPVGAGQGLPASFQVIPASTVEQPSVLKPGSVGRSFHVKCGTCQPVSRHLKSRSSRWRRRGRAELHLHVLQRGTYLSKRRVSLILQPLRKTRFFALHHTTSPPGAVSATFLKSNMAAAQSRFAVCSPIFHTASHPLLDSLSQP